MEKIIEIPEGYEARIEGNKVVLEPKESEDERIRKGLLRHFRNKTKPYWNEIAVKDIIAWLEKLKEHKSDIEICPRTKSKSFLEPYMKGWNDAMASIKPAEWSEEDRRILCKCVDAVNGYIDWKDDSDAFGRWLKSLPERFNLPPKQEWSKEDEKCCKIALLALNDHPLNQDELKAFNWLRALKSRFGWKPTKEQMEALMFAMAIVGRDKYEQVTNALFLLHKQLKNLT